MGIFDFLFKNRGTRQTVAKNTFWIFVSQAGGRLVRAIIVIYAARMIGPTQYGLFSYVLSLAAIISIFSDPGIDTALFKELSQYPERMETYAGTAFISKCALALLGAALIVFLGPLVSTIPEANIIIPIIAVLSVFDTIREFGIALARAEEKMEREAIVNIATNVGIVVLGIAAIIASRTAYGLAIGYMLGSSAGAILTLYFYRRMFREAHRTFSFAVLWRLAAIAFPLTLAAIVGTLMINTDTYLLGFWRSAAEIGFYAAAQRPITVLYGIIGIIPVAAFPMMSRFLKTERNKFVAMLRITLHVSSAFIFPIVAGGAVIASPLIQFVYGSGYSDAAPNFQILLFTLIINFGNVALTYGLLAYDAQRSLLYYTLGGFVINAIGDVLFIPKFGGPGSAAVTLVSQLFIAILLWRKLRLLTKSSFIPRIGKALTATVIMSAAAYALSSFNVMAVVGVCGILYAFLLWILREPTIDELNMLVQSLRTSGSSE